MKEMKVIRRRKRRKPGRYNSGYSYSRPYSYGYGANCGGSSRQRNGKSPLLIAVTFCAVILVFGVCTLCFKFLQSKPYSYSPTEVAATEPCVIENGQSTSLIIKVGEVHILSVPVSDKEMDKLEFISSDPEIVTIDSGGRIDALKEGQATVTAQGKDFSGTCTVTVDKADKQKTPSEYTTAYIANLDIVEKNKKDGSQNLYSVKINRRTNTVTVYTYDENGNYVVPVRAMVCSCGEMTQENITPVGEYSVYFKNYWHALFGDVYGKYVTGFSGHYLFHSVPYMQTESYTLKADEFNKLGTNASQGCVRLMISDVKWIYDNLDMYSEVIVIDESAKADPLGTPPTVKVDTSIGWDPTDPHKDNPYNKKLPVISGVQDITVKKNSDFDPKVTAVDSCSQDITDRIEVIGNVITSKKGTYKVTYKVTDVLGKTASQTVTVIVE